MDRNAYTPLPGRVAGPMYSARLYAGPDHLLKTTVQGFHEHFRRFAWEDIQGLVVEETPWNGVVNVLLVMVLLMLVVSFLTYTDQDWRVATLYMPFLALISLLMLINLRRGPTCKAWLVTAVSRERLWSVNRVAVAESFIGIVGPIIRLRQAAAAEADTDEAYGEEEAPVPVNSPAVRKMEPMEIERGRWHAAGVLLVAGFLTCDIVNVNLAKSNDILDFLELSAFAASCMVCITALVGQIRHRSQRALQRLGFALVAYHIGVVMLGLGSVAASLAGIFTNQGKIPDMEPRNTSWFLPILYTEMAMQVAVLSFAAYSFYVLRRRGKDREAGFEP